jgi:hypothetical protein
LGRCLVRAALQDRARLRPIASGCAQRCTVNLRWPVSSGALATLPATLALAPAVGCGGHAAGTRHRRRMEGVRRITEPWTKARRLWFDAAPTVASHLPRQLAPPRKPRTAAPHTHTHTRRGRSGGRSGSRTYWLCALDVVVGCALDADDLQRPRP